LDLSLAAEDLVGAVRDLLGPLLLTDGFFLSEAVDFLLEADFLVVGAVDFFFVEDDLVVGTFLLDFILAAEDLVGAVRDLLGFLFPAASLSLCALLYESRYAPLSASLSTPEPRSAYACEFARASAYAFESVYECACEWASECESTSEKESRTGFRLLAS